LAELNEIKLEGENVPEKFKGKTVADILTSMAESEKLAHEATEKASGLETENQALQDQIDAEPDPDPDPDPGLDPDPDPDDEYDEYVTKKDMAKYQTDIKKAITDTIKVSQDETAVQTNAQFERRSFLANHPELFENKDEKTKNAIITQVAANAYAAGKKTLEEGLEAFIELGTHLGVSAQNEAEVRVIPTPDLEHGVGEFATVPDELKHMIDVHKTTSGSISGLIKKD